jgi:hypothetical protein
MAARFQLTLFFRELTWLPQLPSLYLLGTAKADSTVHSRIRCSGNLFTEPFPSNGRLFLLIKKLLPRNERHFYLFLVRCLDTNIVSEPFATNGCFSDPTVLALNKYATILTILNLTV